VIAAIIHLRLKIDDRAKISMILFLFNWEVLPTMAVSVNDTMTMGASKNIMRYIGANFCHVIKVIAVIQEDFFTMETNHEWNGTLATFKNSAEIPP